MSLTMKAFYERQEREMRPDPQQVAAQAEEALNPGLRARAPLLEELKAKNRLLGKARFQEGNPLNLLHASVRGAGSRGAGRG